MFGLIIIGMLLFSMMGTGAYSIMMMMEQTQNIASAQNEKSNLKSIELSVVNSLLPISENGELLAPMGYSVTVDIENEKNKPDADNIHQHLPSFIPANKINAWGNAYVYCPFGDNISSSEFSSYGNASFYDEQIPLYVVNKTTSSNLWVTSSTLNKVVDSYKDEKYSAGVDYSTYSFANDYLNDNDTDKVLAVIISRMHSSSSTCEDLTYNAEKNKFKTLSGKDIVVAITRETAKLYQSNNPVTLSTHGETSSNAITINSLSESFDSSVSTIYSINIDSDNDRSIVSDIKFEDEFSDSSRKIKIEGNDENKSKISNEDPVNHPRKITFDGVSVLLKNMDFGSGINFDFKNSTVVFENVKIAGSVYLENSNANIIDNLHLKPRNDVDFLVKLNSSTLNISDPLLIDVSQKYSGVNDALIISENTSKVIVLSDIDVIDTLNSDTVSSLFYSDNTSTLSLGSSSNRLSISVGYGSQYLFNNYGLLNIKNANIYSDKDATSKAKMAILLNPGSRLNIENTDIGTSLTKFNIGISDLGASFISGKSTADKEVNIYAGTCVTGGIFSNQISSSSSKQIVGSNNEMNNKSDWDCK